MLPTKNASGEMTMTGDVVSNDETPHVHYCIEIEFDWDGSEKKLDKILDKLGDALFGAKWLANQEMSGGIKR